MEVARQTTKGNYHREEIMDFSIIISDRKPKKKIDVKISILANQTGYHKSHISRVFRGKTTPSIDCLKAISTALGITMDELHEAINTKKRKQRPLRTIYARY